MAEGEHLKLIQGVVTRLAGNSFLLKGWAVTLVAGLTGLAKADSDRDIAWIACAVIVLFALLDAAYLAHERAFRKLYEDTLDDSKAVPVWSLVPTGPSVGDVLAALFSFSVIPLYLALAVGAVLIAVAI